MSLALHALAAIGAVTLIAAPCWLICVHFNAYAERIIDAMLIGKDR